jgi:oligopeptide/dipeptide ABC transporter ATP-binding protein
LGVAYLFITHNFAVVEYLAHDVAVMYLGRIVEQGRAEEVLRKPQHPYTRALLSAVPAPRLEATAVVIRLPGETPSPANPPAGCHFHRAARTPWMFAEAAILASPGVGNPLGELPPHRVVSSVFSGRSCLSVSPLRCPAAAEDLLPPVLGWALSMLLATVLHQVCRPRR